MSIKYINMLVLFIFIFTLMGCLGNLNRETNLNKKETLEAVNKLSNNNNKLKEYLTQSINNPKYEDGDDFSNELLKDLEKEETEYNLQEFKSNIAKSINSKPCKVCSNKTNSRCAGCKTVYYCNKKCQKKDWYDHKNNM